MKDKKKKKDNNVKYVLYDDVFEKRCNQIQEHIKYCGNCRELAESIKPFEGKKNCWLFFRNAGIRCLFFLCKYILGMTKLTEETHLKVCNFVQTWNFEEKKQKFKLVLMPRGTFKTSIITHGYTIHEILRYPDIRIIIDNATLANSRRFLSSIKAQFMYNSLLKQHYGDFVPSLSSRYKLWREDAITVTKRKITTLKEPTIDTTSVENVKVGMHYDLYIMDDLHNELNITTVDQREKVLTHFLLSRDILEPTGRLIVVGTCWHFDDVYQYIINNEKEFEVFKIGAYNSEGKLTFPHILTDEILNQKRELYQQAGKIDFFYSQYMNEIISTETQEFKQEWIRYYTDEDIKNKYLLKYTAVDPAISSSKKSSYTAIITIGVDSQNNIYVLQAEKFRGDITFILNKIFETIDKFSPNKLGIEKVAYQEALRQIVELECVKRNKFIKPEPLQPPLTESKEMRVRGIIPFVHSGKLFIKKEMNDLIVEMLSFPKRTSDLLDALAYSLTFMKIKTVEKIDITKYLYIPDNEYTGY